MRSSSYSRHHRKCVHLTRGVLPSKALAALTRLDQSSPLSASAFGSGIRPGSGTGGRLRSWRSVREVSDAERSPVRGESSIMSQDKQITFYYSL